MEDLIAVENDTWNENLRREFDQLAESFAKATNRSLKSLYSDTGLVSVASDSAAQLPIDQKFKG